MNLPWRNRIVSLLFTIFLTNFLVVVSLPATAREIPRRVLVLYNGAAGQSPVENVVFEGFQTILNYEGILTDYRDVGAAVPLPDGKAMSPYRGILVAVNRISPARLQEVLRWLDRQPPGERKIVLLDNFDIAGRLNDDTDRLLNKLFARLGLERKGNFTQLPRLIRYGHKDPAMVEFERKYPPRPASYEQFRLTDKSARVHLSLVRTDRKDSESAVIVTNRNGGFAMNPYVFWKNTTDNRKQWYLNPFAFLRKALALEADQFPVPDPTTRNGLRAAFSHVDADGFSGPSQAYKQLTCAEVIRDQVLKRYPFPVTVSVIVAEVDPKKAKTTRHADTARDIFRLPNVEPASHSYSHPFYWDPNAKTKGSYPTQLGLKLPGYVFNDKTELDDSMKYITDKLAPPGKPCLVFQWSGDCRPTERQLARLDALGMLNINGGDTVYDAVENSLFGVAPLYRQVGARTQYYIGQANDNILTNLMEGPFYGYRNIITTMERTEKPRRIKPLDIYYHMFSGERIASLKAVQDVYAWALTQEVALMFTSQYLRMMQGYMQARISAEGGGVFTVENYGDCLTVRLPTAAPAPDPEKSLHVLGFYRAPQGLYISLAPGQRKARIVPATGGPGKGPAGATAGRLPFLNRATGVVDSFQVSPGMVRWRFSGFGKGWVELGGLFPGREYEASGQALPAGGSRFRADSRGVLRIHPLATGEVRVRLP